MDEQSLKKHLRHLTIVVGIISLVILAAGSITSYYTRHILEDALENQMKSETEQYRIKISRKIEADFQTLDTLAGFLEFSQMDAAVFLQGFLASDKNNDFSQMGYFPRSETGVWISKGDTPQSVANPDSLDEELCAVIESAWNGEEKISDIYDMTDGEEAAVYAVPVYSGGDIEGALAASVNAEVFEGLIEEQTVLNGQAHMHLVLDNGRKFAYLEDDTAKEELDSEYIQDYFSGEERKKIENALAESVSCFTELKYEGITYKVFLMPMDIKGWYLFCVQTAKNVSGDIYGLMMDTRIVTLLGLSVVLFIIGYGYRTIYKNSSRLIKRAYYDPLTEAYNLPGFENKISKIIETTEEYSLAALNVRQFKFINEIFGISQADSLLCHIKKVIGDNILEGEHYCRGSGDMFFILFRQTDKEVIRDRLKKIMDEISQYAMGTSKDYPILVYCGIVVGTDTKDSEPSVQKTMTHVRFALATAKQSVKRNIWFYDTQLHEAEKLENYVESHMQQALDNGEFKLYLQPKIDLAAGKVAGAEALVRWIPETGETLYPGQFIPLFENNGFCASLDMYMVEQVCRQIRRWMDQGADPMPVSVNQSKLAFYETDYIKNMKALIDKYEIPAELITLEILEGLAIENEEELNDRIDSLKEIGFRISMDDFGNGYSSLNTLAGLKIDELKFDRGFLLGLREENEDYNRHVVIMSGVVEMAKRLSINTVVEGVETKENEELVKKLGCEFGQGYYYSRPVSAEDFTQKYIIRTHH